MQNSLALCFRPFQASKRQLSAIGHVPPLGSDCASHMPARSLAGVRGPGPESEKPWPGPCGSQQLFPLWWCPWASVPALCSRFLCCEFFTSVHPLTADNNNLWQSHQRIEEVLNDIWHVPGNPEHAASARAGLLICELSGLVVAANTGHHTTCCTRVPEEQHADACMTEVLSAGAWQPTAHRWKPPAGRLRHQYQRPGQGACSGRHRRVLLFAAGAGV